MSYIGIPPFGQTVRTVTTFTATSSQTTFTPNGGYTVGYVDVYYNGIRLIGGTDYNASNGSTVVLTTGATTNAIVEIVTYGSVQLVDAARRSGDTFSGAVAFPNNVIITSNGYVGIGNTVPGAPLVVGSASGSFTNPLIQAASSANSWVQINAQNKNNGNNASTDLVLSRSDGNDTSGYIDVGINSNTYIQAGYSIMTPNSGYMFTNGGDLVVGTQTAHNILFHTGNTTAASERMRIDSNGVTVFGNGTRFAYSGAPGDVVFNNGASDTPGIQFQYAANSNIGIDSWNDGTNQFLRIVNDINHAGGAMNINISRNGVINLGGRFVNSGTGIAFPATQNPSSDANTLDDYEEGTWTPTLDFDGVTVTSYTIRDARYVKVGKQVTISGRISINVKGAGTGLARIYGMPFSADGFATSPSYAGNMTACASFISVTGALTGWIENTAFIPYTNNNGTGSFTFGANYQSGTAMTFTATYFTA